MNQSSTSRRDFLKSSAMAAGMAVAVQGGRAQHVGAFVHQVAALDLHHPALAVLGQAGRADLLLDLLGLGLGNRLLDLLRRALDEILGLLQTETRDLANDLDDVDLLVADRGEDDVELRLLLGRRGGGGEGGGRQCRHSSGEQVFRHGRHGDLLAPTLSCLSSGHNFVH